MKLCAGCRRIPFHAFSRGISERQKGSWHLGDLYHAQNTSGRCHFCAFLIESYKLANEIEPSGAIGKAENVQIHLLMIPTHKKNPKSPEEPWFEHLGVESEGEAGPSMWLHFSDDPNTLKEPLIYVSLERKRETNSGILVKPKAILPRRRRESEVQNPFLDYKLIRKWLRICKKRHIRKCGTYGGTDEKQFPIRLIDVRKREIKLGIKKPYASLSYVWPKDRKDVDTFWKEYDSTKNLKLQAKVDQTIEDAMIFTEKVGLRYLWVDAYCINQEDEDERSTQIHGMHFVYKGADLTIVVHDGTNEKDGRGIAGISRPFRNLRQPKVTLDIGRLMATYIYPIMLRQGKPTPYETRAWTLSEMVLSKRAIILNELFVSMRCRSELFYDLLEVGDNSCPKFKQCKDYFWDNGFSVNLENDEFSLVDSDNLVASHTKRHLSHPTDIWNSGRGLFNEMTARTGVKFIQGIPKRNTHEALLWKPYHGHGGCLTRREQFPSWSWTGWIGRAENHYCIDNLEADKQRESTEKKRKRLKRTRDMAFPENRIPNDATIELPSDKDDTGKLRISSQIARVTVRNVRLQDAPVENLPENSEQPNKAIGDHWVILDQCGRPLCNHIGEVSNFEATDYSFRVHPGISDLISSKEISRESLCHNTDIDGTCELIFIKNFPRLRDERENKRFESRSDQVGCIVIVPQTHDPTAVYRIGMNFLALEDWNALLPEKREISIS